MSIARAEPDLPRDGHQWRHRQRFPVQHVAEREQHRASERQDVADHFAGTERITVGSQQQGNAGQAKDKRNDIARRWAHVKEWPGEQHGPDRHGVDNEGTFGDAHELHRDRAESHLGEDIGEGGDQQPRHRLAWNG